MSVNFGIPQEARNFKPFIGPLVKTGEKVSGQKQPVALDYFKVLDSNGQLIPAYNDRPEELLIELISDNIADFWRDKLACYDGRSQFCFNDTGTHTALRRGANGVYVPVECDPARCTLRLNETNAQTPEESKADVLSVHQREICERWKPAYPYAHLDAKSKCKSQTYFLFSLPHPKHEGEYITRPGEFARYSSQSRNINAQLLSGLRTIAVRSNGMLAGLRCKLVMSFNKSSYGTNAPTVGIVGPSDAEMAEAYKGMALRRGLLRLDMEKVMAGLAQMSAADLEAVDNEYLYQNFYLAEHKELPEHSEVLALPSPGERMQVKFATENPLVSALCEKLRLSYAAITKLQMQYGADVQRFIDKLLETAEENKIDVSGVLARYKSTSLPDCAATVQTAPAPSFDDYCAPEPEEPEFTEINDEPEPEPELTEDQKGDLFADLKKKFEKDS